MPKLLQSAAVGLAFTTLAAVAPASADGYLERGRAYGYVPRPEFIDEPGEGPIVYSYSEVRIYRGAPAYGYGAAYLPGPPDAWRRRDVGYDTVVTREKRVIRDYGPPAYYRRPAYGSIKDGPLPVGVVEPDDCGAVEYWNGCKGGRYHSRHYKRKYIRRW